MNKFILIATFAALMPLTWSSVFPGGLNSKNYAISQRKFSASLLKSLNNRDEINGNRGNIIFSPYNIHHVLSLIYYGAKGATKDSLEKVLNFTPFINDKKDMLNTYHANKQKYSSYRQQHENEFGLVDRLFIKPEAQLL